MCGRFTRNYTWAQIHAMYSLTWPAANLQPRFNIGPTDTVDALVDHQLESRGLLQCKWQILGRSGQTDCL